MKKRDNLLRLTVPFLILIFLSVLEGNGRPVFAQFTPDKEAVKKPEEKIETPPTPAGQRGPTPVRSSISIAEKNIFNPERKDFPVQAGPKPVARPRIILYGVTIAGDYQSASVMNPGRSLHKGERETITLRMGEQIGGYKLAKVSSDRILLEGVGDSFEVLLYDAAMPKRRIDTKTESKPVSLTSTQPGPASPAEVPKPPQESAQKPTESAPEKVVTSPSPPTPWRPSSVPAIPPGARRGTKRVYPPSETPMPTAPPASPGSSPQGTGSN
jgi:hypothetical protein